MDPLTITAAMSVANSAFNAIKQGFAAAKEGRTLGGQLRYIYSQYVSEEQKRVKELVDAEMTLRKAKDHSAAG